MRKQICFAGFEEREIAALQPALAALEGAWHCVFSPNAASALAALEAVPFDVAVANLRQGGISDSELLHQAAVRHPRTLRFVLGDAGERELIVNCMGAAHQFVSRPWKPQELITIIERSLALDAWLSNDKLRSFVPRLGKLPGLPSTYFEVLKKTESPNASIESIAEVIARDPALTARLLQMVNSPACGLNEKIISPAEAVSMLGLDTVKSIVLCLQVFAASAPAQAAGLSLDQLWQHSFRVAKLSAKIVLRCIASQRMASEAYTAGLLHNIGQIVLATNLSGEYSAVVETARKLKCPIQEAELKLLGVIHNQVGAYLLGLWGMPLSLLEATALHHAPASATTVEFSLLTAVHVANVLACEESGRNDGIARPKLECDYLAKLELPKKPEAWRKFLASVPRSETRVERQAARAVSPPEPAPKQGARPSGKLILFGVMVAIIVAGAALRRNTAPAAHNGDSALAAVNAPEPGGSEGTNAPVAVTPFDAIKIQGIVFSAGRPVALINGKALVVGERINGVQVVSIEPSIVVLACNGEKKSFKLK